MAAIEWTNHFKRVYKKKPVDMQKAIRKCMEQLSDNPRHNGLNVHKVRGTNGVWEAYIDDGNRITFEYRAGTILFRNNCNHDMLFRNP